VVMDVNSNLQVREYRPEGLFRINARDFRSSVRIESLLLECLSVCFCSSLWAGQCSDA
jgi:hypothetical protein